MNDTASEARELNIDGLENEFFEQFMSPEGELAQDPDTFEYEWTVTEWTTRDAVRSIFEDRLSETEIDELASDLDLTSTSWMNTEEYRELADEEGRTDDFDPEDDDED
ncbi:MAG: hypothetical protein HIU88_09005 [Acidobacteria bacterium]|nr:hypothetical protein [Acidobacteriota bacterium]